jgi:hypothetical protein
VQDQLSDTHQLGAGASSAVETDSGDGDDAREGDCEEGDSCRGGSECWVDLGVGVIAREGRLGGVDGGGRVDQGSWGDGDCREVEGDSEHGEGDEGVVRIVGGEMNRGRSRSSLFSLSSSNSQLRFLVFFAGTGAVGESA